MHPRSNFISVFFLIAASLSLGCAMMEMNVKAYGDPDRDLAKFRTFRIVAIDKEDPLIEKQMLALIRSKLLFRGLSLAPDSDAPDFLVTTSFYTGSFQYYKPPVTIDIPVYDPGETKTSFGSIGGVSYHANETTSGKWGSRPTAFGGGADTAYYRNIRVYMFARGATSAKPELVWQGEADSTGSTADIIVVAPHLLDELLDEFPTKTGRATRRSRDLYNPPTWVRQ